MVKDSIDIQPPYAKKKREFIAAHEDRADTIYIQKRQFDRKGVLEQESWKLDNGQEVLELDDADYISRTNAEELRMQSLEPAALMKMAKKQDYFGTEGLICMLYQGKIYYSSKITEISPPFTEEFEPEYDISKDFEDFNKR